MAALGVQPPDIEPRATQHVDEMISDDRDSSIEKGFAYEAEGHVLFDVTSNPESYGSHCPSAISAK